MLSCTCTWPAVPAALVFCLLLAPSAAEEKDAEGRSLGAGWRRALWDGGRSGTEEWQPWFLPVGSDVRLSDFKRGIELNADLVGGGNHAADASWAAWRRLKAKLEARDGVLGVGIGSSVLGIHGGCTTAPAPQFASLCPFCCRPRTTGNPNATTGTVARFGRGWARVGVDFLRHQYGGAVEFVNYARPGGAAQMFNHCLHKWAPDLARADFAVLEFNVVAQDAQAEDGRAEMREVEGVLRQLLSLPRPPAIVLMNFFSWCRDVPALCEPHTTVTPEALQDLSRIFTHTGRSDARLRELATRYGLPVASALVSFWPVYFPGVDPVAAAEGRPSGLREQPPFMRLRPGDNDQHTRAHLADGIHPTTAGNTVFGPWFAYVLHQALSAVLLTATHDDIVYASLTPAQLPATLYGPRYSRPTTGACFDFASVPLRGGDTPSNITLARHSSLPDVKQMGTSTFFSALPNFAFVNPAEIASSSGFSYVEMVPAADGTLRWKPGVEAVDSGAYIDVAYRYRASVMRRWHEAADGDDDRPDEICITYLSSYEHMGQAEMSCAGDCACGAKAFNAHRAERGSVEESLCNKIVLEPAERARQRTDTTAGEVASNSTSDAIAGHAGVDHWRRAAGGGGAVRVIDGGDERGNAFGVDDMLCVVHVEVTSATESDSHHLKLTAFTVRTR